MGSEQHKPANTRGGGWTRFFDTLRRVLGALCA